MAEPVARSPNPAIREVVRRLRDARDAQILAAVRMVDAMPERGQADQLIAPLRPRLARLRPPRPLRFARLMFLPLDPLIVPAARWHLSDRTIPRTVVPVLAAAVAAGLGTEAAAVHALIDGRTTDDEAAIEEAGALLWPRASAFLLGSAPTPGWEATGLPLAALAPTRRCTGALLSQAGRLRRLATDAARGLTPPDPAIVAALVLDALAFAPDVQPMLIALLLARVPEAAPVLARAAVAAGPRGEALLRGAGEDAAELLLDQLEKPGATESQIGGDDLSEAGAAVRRLTALLTTLDGEAPAAARRERLTALRRRIGAGCEALFAERMSADLLTPLRDGGLVGDADLETAARGLRALETEARRIAGGGSFDALLGQASGLVREGTANGTLDRADGARLLEILSGPEAALSLLGLDSGAGERARGRPGSALEVGGDPA